MKAKQIEITGYLNHSWFYSILVIFSWGIVPALAKTSNLPGGYSTFWVSLFSAVSVLLIMLVKGYLSQFRATKYYRPFILLSIFWPLINSLAFFSVIKASNGSMTTLLNYLWPLFALLFLTRKMRIPPIGIILALFGFLGIALSLFLDGSLKLVFGPLIFGFAIPVTQAYFNVATTDDNVYPTKYAWLLTFVGALVTTIGSAIYIMIFENRKFSIGVPIATFIPLAIIGLVGNTIGFYSFLRAGQLSKEPSEKVWFILLMFLIPFAQVFFLVITRVESNISPARFIGIVIVAISFLAFKLWEKRNLKISKTGSQERG